MRYAEIALNAPIYLTYTYLIPQPLARTIALGHLVEVPLGKSTAAGIVIALTDEAPTAGAAADHERAPREITTRESTTREIAAREIAALLDPDPVVDAEAIALARWMADAYLNPIGLSLWVWLPPGYAGARDMRYALVESAEAEALHARHVHTPIERDLVALLERRGPLRGAQLNTALRAREWKLAADGLARAGVLEKTPVLAPPRAKAKQIDTASLAIAADDIPAALARLARPSREADLLEAVGAAPGGRPLDEALQAAGALRKQADSLVARGAIRLEAYAHTGGTAAQRFHAEQVFSPEAAAELAAELRRIAVPARVLRMLARERARGARAVAVDWVYGQTGAARADLRRLADAGVITLGDARRFRASIDEHALLVQPAPRLTPEQSAAFEPIDMAILSGEHRVFLLHGITGSGKTEVYLRTMQAAVTRGRTALYLVPEISLTPQTIARVTARFGAKRVGVVHSRISEGERLDTWRRAREGAIDIIIGARSGLFTPLDSLGAIILDEEHDSSYKQSDRFPVYDARAAAEKLAQAVGAVVVLGSATPDIETAYRAERVVQGERLAHLTPLTTLRLKTRVAKADGGVIAPPLPAVHVVDMRAELKSGNSSIFSRALQTGLRETLERGEQAILFLNRRGQSTYVFCRDCGYTEKCPRCATPLTYHRDGYVRCHRCNYSSRPAQRCPDCSSHRIRFFGAGTQQVEATMHSLFPDARVLRWDADTAHSARAYELILSRFTQHEADVLVGTQMVTKGLDLPLVTLVGVVSADIGLSLPDFHAPERTFQTLTQVAGRAGRGGEGGRVILQTYQPEHYAIQAAAAHDHDAFYAREIAYRRAMGYPPFRRMVRIIFKFAQEARAEREAEKAALFLRGRLEALGMTATELIGPAPCFYTREDGDYRWHLILRGPDPTPALRGLEPVPGWRIDVDPIDLL
jgi:primosomal protein N' (replication factor Y)